MSMKNSGDPEKHLFLSTHFGSMFNGMLINEAFFCPDEAPDL